MTDSPVVEPEAALIAGQQSVVQRGTPAVSRLCCTLFLGPSRRIEIHPDNVQIRKTCPDFHVGTYNWWLHPHLFLRSRPEQ